MAKSDEPENQKSLRIPPGHKGHHQSAQQEKQPEDSSTSNTRLSALKGAAAAVPPGEEKQPQGSFRVLNYDTAHQGRTPPPGANFFSVSLMSQLLDELVLRADVHEPVDVSKLVEDLSSLPAGLNNAIQGYFDASFHARNYQDSVDVNGDAVFAHSHAETAWKKAEGLVTLVMAAAVAAGQQLPLQVFNRYEHVTKVEAQRHHHKQTQANDLGFLVGAGSAGARPASAVSSSATRRVANYTEPVANIAARAVRVLRAVAPVERCGCHLLLQVGERSVGAAHQGVISFLVDISCSQGATAAAAEISGKVSSAHAATAPPVNHYALDEQMGHLALARQAYAAFRSGFLELQQHHWMGDGDSDSESESEAEGAGGVNGDDDSVADGGIDDEISAMEAAMLGISPAASGAEGGEDANLAMSKRAGQGRKRGRGQFESLLQQLTREYVAEQHRLLDSDEDSDEEDEQEEEEEEEEEDSDSEEDSNSASDTDSEIDEEKEKKKKKKKKKEMRCDKYRSWLATGDVPDMLSAGCTEDECRWVVRLSMSELLARLSEFSAVSNCSTHALARARCAAARDHRARRPVFARRYYSEHGLRHFLMLDGLNPAEELGKWDMIAELLGSLPLTEWRYRARTEHGLGFQEWHLIDLELVAEQVGWCCVTGIYTATTVNCCATAPP
jgi:hypothetical protein